MEDPDGIFALWLDFRDTFFIVSFKYFNFFSHRQKSVIQTYFIAVPVIFRKTYKKNHGGLVPKSHWYFSFNNRWQFGNTESGKKKISYLLACVVLKVSFRCPNLSKLNFQFSPEYSASASTYETSWCILLWIDLVSSAWKKLQFPFNFLANSKQ